MTTINKRITTFREDLRMTKAALAKKIGVKTQSVQHWEAGRTSPRRKLLPALAKALQVTIADLELGKEQTATTRKSGHVARESAASDGYANVLTTEAVEVAKAWSLLSLERQVIYRSLIFNDAVLEQALPEWLRFGNPRSPRYKDFELKFEQLARENKNQLTLDFQDGTNR
ncbi:MAG: helix-turn-helix transcriptional regulator [Phycisphaerales bacterium]|nr:helix-turn-helix transcriptional regulator [Phycisphaerales bacterium]